MKYFLDTEFDSHNGPLLSLSLIREDGFAFYYTDRRVKAKDPWVIENVVPVLELDFKGHPPLRAWADVPLEFDNRDAHLGELIRSFVADDISPQFIADSPVDICRLTLALTTDAHGGWQPCGYPEMTFTVENIDCYPTTAHNGPQHNAYYDALALKAKLEERKE